MRVLTVNVGSSSLKLRLLGPAGELLASEDLAPGRAGLVAQAARALPAFDAAGHRFVHGGPRLRASALVDDRVVALLHAAVELAPLHNAAALAAIEELRRALPELPQVACFDTAFHRTLPDRAAVYPVPWEWTERLGVRRLGFHGLSHAHAGRRAAELIGAAPAELRLVTCHLGAGASLCAVQGGRSVDTTMGFTPNDGLMMARRSGALDPGALLWVMRRERLTPERADHALEHESGLLGVSGVSSDMRAVAAAADGGERRARLAIGVYVHRLSAAIAAMAAAMGGLDGVVFTGGVGEGSALVRARACEPLRFLGIAIAPGLNDSGAAGDRELTAPGAAVRTLVVRAREDIEIAAETRRLLAA